MTFYVYVFTPNYAPQLRGGHQLWPEGLATVICKTWTLLELGLVRKANSPGSGAPDVPLLCLFTSTWITFLDWMAGRPLQRQIHHPSGQQHLGLIAKPTIGPGVAVPLPWRPADVSIAYNMCEFLFRFYVHV